MTLTIKKNGVEVTLTPQQEAQVRAAWASNKIQQDADRVVSDALDSQVTQEKADLPTWLQVKAAIENAFTDNAQANIIKKIARPVYTHLKGKVD